MPDTMLSAATVGHIHRIADFDVMAVRREFPVLCRVLHEKPGRPGKPLVFLDSGASAQKPRVVIEAMVRCLEHSYANVHRGVHTLSQESTDLFEAARSKVARFLGADSADEIVFTRNATEAINLVASSFGRTFLEPGDEVVLTIMEHHANIVPWQLLQAERGIVIRVVPCDDRGVLDLDAYTDLLGPRTKLVAVSHCSNVLGTVNPVTEITGLAHARGIPVLIDGSQAVVHQSVNVRAIDADFYVFTGHKLYGPTGIGVLYGKAEMLRKMPPWQGGGDMIEAVSFAGTTFREPPARFEAGTPPIMEAIGLGAAIDWLDRFDREAISDHEQALLVRATAGLEALPGVRIIGTAPDKAAILSFTLDGVHPHDLGTLLDRAGVAIRVGRHCAEPLIERFEVGSTARASFALYNTLAEADALVAAVAAVREFFA
ncbi:L-cysteine desulfurase [uncultured Gammaproteobacteria bacterium]